MYCTDVANKAKLESFRFIQQTKISLNTERTKVVINSSYPKIFLNNGDDRVRVMDVWG